MKVAMKINTNTARGYKLFIKQSSWLENGLG